MSESAPSDSSFPSGTFTAKTGVAQIVRLGEETLLVTRLENGERRAARYLTIQNIIATPDDGTGVSGAAPCAGKGCGGKGTCSGACVIRFGVDEEVMDE